jgi:WD40 repeat protein
VTSRHVGKYWDAATAVTSMDFVREVGRDRLAVADQGRSLHLIPIVRPDQAQDPEPLVDLDLGEVQDLSCDMVAYGLASVPRRTDPPGLAAVGQRIIVFASDGERLFDPIELPGSTTGLTTALAVTALVDNELTVIAVGGKDKNRDADVYLYRGNTGSRGNPGQLQLLHHLLDEGNGAVRAIEALRLERYLLVAHDGGISTWDISQRADRVPPRLRTFGRGDTRAMTVFYDPQGRPRLATASTHGIEIWDPGPEGSEHPLGCFARDINATAIAAVASEHPDPQLAVADDHSVWLWSTTTEVRERELPDKPQGQITYLATSPAGDGSTLLAAANDSGRVVVWRLPKVQSTTRPYGRHDRWVNALASAPAGQPLWFASASDDRTVRLWQPEPGPDPDTLPGSSRAAVQALAVLPAAGDEADRLISGDEAGHLTSWKMPEGKTDKEEDIVGAVRALATIHDQAGRQNVVAAGAEARLTVWDIDACSSGSPIEFPYPESADPTLVRALAVGKTDKDLAVGKTDKDEELLAAGDSHGRVTVWRTSTRQQLWTNAGRHQGQVRALAWIPTVEGVRLASGGSDGNIYLWPPDGEEPKRFEGHCGPVAALAALSTADRQVPTSEGEVHLFVSGGADGTIRTWNPDTPGDPHVLPHAHPGWVRALLRLEHGGALHVVSGGDDGTVRQWVIVDGEPQSTTHVGRLPGFGDRPARADLLGREKFQDVLVSLLRLIPEPSPPPRYQATQPTTHESEADEGVRATGPRVVAVRGPWGAGKTSLMRFIYKELRENDGTSSDWDTGPTGPERDQQPEPSGNQTSATSSQADPSRSAQGARKTSLMRFIHQLREDDPTTFTARQAAQQASDGPTRQSGLGQAPPPSKILPVWFNPWAHKSAEEVWAGLTQQIIDAAKLVLGKTDGEWQRYWFTRNLKRLDGAEVRRVLRRRIFWQPLLSSPALAPLIAAVVATAVKWPATIPYIAAAGFVAALAAISVRWRRPARAYLPADIMEAPVLSGFQANPGPFAAAASADDLLLHDPLYRARSGYLYLVQHDVKDLADELAQGGYMLVVLIDDLDRCPPETVAEVLQAVNIFLAEEFAHAKFVIGLDPSVVAHDLAEVFRSQESRLRDDPDDPNLGWSFLRKLCQLPLTLPAIREAHTARLMRRHTPSGEPRSYASASHPSSKPATTMPAGNGAGGPREAGTSRDDTVPEATEAPDGQPVADDNRGAGAPSQSTPAPAEPLFFEADPVIRDHLRALMRLRPHQSVRETKRLLTLWAFYLKLLPKLLPRGTTSSAQFGRDVLTLAEILTRWPALAPKLGPSSSPESGLRELIEAAKSGAAPPQVSPWDETLRRLGLDGDKFHSSCENLRELLRLYGNDEVAYYAECVL